MLHPVRNSPSPADNQF